MPSSLPLRLSALAALCLGAADVVAQQQGSLLQVLPPPAGSAQESAALGTSVAMNALYTVAGVPFDDVGGQDSGLVKIFDTASGALLYVLPNPSPNTGDQFGNAVAISGNRVVVGAFLDDTDALNAGRAYVFDLGGITPTVPVLVLSKPSAVVADQFGFAVAISGQKVAVSANLDDTGAPNTGRVFVYDLASGTPQVPTLSINNPTPVTSDLFGQSLSMDGGYLVVGVPQKDPGGVTNAGSVELFNLNSATPKVPVASISNPHPATADAFGNAVSLQGTRFVVGTSMDDATGVNSGRVYGYDFSAGPPTAAALVIDNPGPAVDDQFGHAVAIYGSRVVVGTPYDDTGATNSGRAYVFDMAGVQPHLAVAALAKTTPVAADNLSLCVAIFGNQVVAGVPFDDQQISNTGSVAVYDLNGPAPGTPQRFLRSPSPSSGDLFGGAVSISGTRMVVGANLDDTGALNAGSAYVFDLASPAPGFPVLALFNPEPSLGAEFGYAVAISGTWVAVSAPFSDSLEANDVGRVYVYNLASATPSVPVVVVNNPEPAASDQFGNAVALSGNRLVVGTRLDDALAINSGSVYVYNLAGATPATATHTLRNPSPAAQDFFGHSVAVSQQRVIVGAPYNDAGAVDAGRAYVYDLNGATPTQPAFTLNNPAPATGDQFGFSVAAAGNLMAVGANTDDAGASDAGSVYVYNLAGATPAAPAWTLFNPQPAANDQFGISVALDGQRVVVGAHLDDLVMDEAGTAWVYDLSAATPTTPELILWSNTPGVNDQFGIAVAASEGRVLVGASRADLVTPDKGAAFVFGAQLVQEAVDISVEHPVGSPLISGVASVAFGSTLVGGEPVNRTFVVRNMGTDPLTGIAASMTGAQAGDFVIQQAPVSSLPAGGTSTLVVRFSPSAGGARGAQLRIASNDPDENPFLVSLTGNGLVPTPDIALEQPVGNSLTSGAAQVTFGQAAVGGGSSDRVFTVRNTGTADLTGIQLSLAGTNPSAYFVLVPPASILGVGASTSFTLRFAPQTSGELTAVVRVASNDPDENPFDVFLYGVAVVTPDVVVEQPAGSALANGQATIQFGTAAVSGQASERTFTVRNRGTGPLSALGLALGGAHAGDFQVVVPLPPSIPAGDSSVFVLRFAPLAGGARSATVALSSNDPDDNPFVIALAGTGTVAPDLAIELPVGNPLYPSQSTVDFGNAALGGDPLNKVLTLRNTGTASLTGINPVITGDHAADFQVVGAIVTTLAPGQTASLTIRFAATAPDQRYAYLEVASNDPEDNPFELELTGFAMPLPDIVLEQPAGQALVSGATVNYGQVNAGLAPVEKTFKLRNGGTGPLSGITLQIQGADSADFALATFPPNSLEPQQQAFFAVRYTPVREKVSNARLVMRSNDPDEDPFEVNLTGEGISVPDIRIDQPSGNILVTNVSAVGFGTAAVGETFVDRVFTLRNEGQAPLQNMVASFTGSHAADFSVQTVLPGTLAADGSTTFVIRYAPKAGGNRTAAFSLANNDPDENPFVIQLSGFATTRPNLALEFPAGTALTHTVSTVDFGSLLLGGGGSTDRQITLRNTGSGTLNSIAVTFFGGQAGDFTLIAAPPAILAPGQSASCTVRFAPGAGGARQTSLRVASNNPTNNPFAINLTGTGQVVPDITIEQPVGNVLVTGAAEVNFGASMPGGPPTTRSFTIRNDGNGPLSGITTQLTGSSATQYAVTTAPAASLAPGQSTTLMVAFSPVNQTPHSAILSVGSDDPDENPFLIALTGTGSIVPDIAIEQPVGNDLASGLGVVTFGSALVRDSWQERTFTLRNTGTDTLQDVVLTLVGAAAADFEVRVVPPSSFAPSASAAFVVRFAPKSGGDRSATLRVASNDPDENPFTLSLTGFGVAVPDIVVEHPVNQPLTAGAAAIDFGTIILSAPSANRVVTLRNTGTGPLQIFSATLNGAQAADFSLSQSPPASVPAGGSATLTVRFTPTVNGARAANLVIASDDPDTAQFAIALSGTGLAQPDIALEHPVGQNLVNGAASVACGTVVLGAPPSSRSVLMRNTGTASLGGLAVAITGAHPADFSLTSFRNTPLAPGESTAFNVLFKPDAEGPRSATLVISSDDPDENPFEIVLTGSGLAQPAIRVEYPQGEPLQSGSADLAFAPLLVGSDPGELALTLRNTGTAVLGGLAFSYTGSHPDDFSVSGTPPSSLPPGGSVQVTLLLRPLTIGQRSATLRILSNDPNQSPFLIQVSGSAQDYFTEIFSATRPNDSSGGLYTLRPATLIPGNGNAPLPAIETPPSQLQGTGVADAFASAEVLATREVPDAFDQSRVIVERLVRTALKHPLLRVQDHFEISGAKRRRVSQTAAVADHVLVKPNLGVEPATLLSSMAVPGAQIRSQLPASGLWLVSFPAADLDSLPQAVAAALGSGNVTLAEPDPVVNAAALPNDTAFASQWHLNNSGQSGGVVGMDIAAAAAWDAQTGSSSVLVGVLDTGIDHTHPDLAANIWTNPGEIPGNGIDDDSNGYIDDVRGWNFVTGTANASDDHSHGTHVAGTLGAVGNNGLGVAGTAWRVALVPLKILDATGAGFTSDAAEALAYSGSLNVALTCNAWGGGGFSQALRNLIIAAGTANRLFIAAAGNNSRNTDSEPHYPAGYDFDNTLTVTAINDRGQLSWFANRGANSAHLAAPGSGIYSTLPGGGYGFRDGTSAAAAQVAGVCVLVKAAQPSWSAARVKSAVLGGVDALASLADHTISGGRLNAAKALQAATTLGVTPAKGLAASADQAASRQYTLRNLSATSMAYSVAASQPWVGLSAASGTLAVGQSQAVNVTLLPGAATLPAGTHTAQVTFTQTATGATFTRSIVVTSVERYHASRLPISVFPTDPTGGSPLLLADDSFVQIPLGAGARIPLFGLPYSSVFVGSNGYVTFGSGDWRPGGDADHHFALPRLSAVSADLNPAAGGTVSWRQLADHIAITFEGVPEYGGAGLNSFQFQLFFDGRLTITILAANAPGNVMGLSEGRGLPDDFASSDFSRYPDSDLSLARFTSDPVSQQVLAGETVLFEATTVGAPTITYQWLHNGAAIPGATSIAYPIPSATVERAGTYQLVASNAFGQAFSQSATLSVQKRTATVELQNLVHTFNGGVFSPAALTAPAGLATSMTYNGASSPPAAAGSYLVEAQIVDPVYQGASSATMVINKAPQIINFAAPGEQRITMPLVLSATGGISGNPVVFSLISGPAILNEGNTLTFTGTGQVTVTATQEGNINYADASPVTRVFNVVKTPATVTLGGLAHLFDGAVHPVTVSTQPQGLNVSVLYDGNPAPPGNAGTYAVTAVINSSEYEGSAAASLVISKAPQAILFAAIPDQPATATVNLAATGGASGNPVQIVVTSGPALLSGSALSFTGAGSVTITASQVGNTNYLAAAPVARTFTVSTVAAAVSLANLQQLYDGTARTVGTSTTPGSLRVDVTYDGNPAPPVNPGSYAVTATINEPLYHGSASGTLMVGKLTADILLTNLEQTYDGTPRVVTAITVPGELQPDLTYDGSSVPPLNAGAYTVTATVNDVIYQGSASATLVVGLAGQEIYFPAIPDQLTSASLSLSAAGGASGNPVQFVVTSGPGVITGGRVLAFTGAGSVTITASQTGNANFLPATAVSNSFNVAQSRGAVYLSELYQAPDGAPKPVIVTTAPSGLNVRVTYDGSETPPTGVGRYEVAAVIEHPAYIGSATGTLVLDHRADRELAEPVEESEPPAPVMSDIEWEASAAGRYNGLLVSDDEDETLLGEVENLVISPPKAGSALGGLATGKLRLNGRTATLRGSFARDGLWTVDMKQKDGTRILGQLRLQRTDAGHVVVTGALGWAGASVRAWLPQAPFHARNHPAPDGWTGRFSLVLGSPSGSGLTEPGGDGWATVTISPSGLVKLAGKLADGTALTETTSLSAAGEFTPFKQLYRSQPTQGHIGGLLRFQDIPEVSDFHGFMHWLKRPDTRDRLYPAGFFTCRRALGSRYTAPAPGSRLLAQLIDADPNASLSLLGPNLPPDSGEEIEHVISWQKTNALKHYGPETLGGTANRTTGLVSGRYRDPASGMLIDYQGMVFQKQGLAAGYFLYGSGSGALRIQPGTHFPYPGGESAGSARHAANPAEAAPPPATTLAAFEAAAAGTFHGVLQDSGAASGGIENLRVTKSGAFTGSLWLRGVRHAVAGAFAADGRAAITLPDPNGGGPLHLVLELRRLDASPEGFEVTGLLSAAGVDHVFSAQQLPSYALSRRSPHEGGYTLALLAPDTVDPAAEPEGDGYATLRVNYLGLCTGALVLPDGAKATFAGHVSRDGRWSLLRSLYGSSSRGYLAGTLQFRAISGSGEVDGSWTWQKRANATPKSPHFAAGFTTTRPVVGSLLQLPASGTPVWPELAHSWHNAWWRVTGPGLLNRFAAPLPGLDRAVTWSPSNRVTYFGADSLTIKVNRATGLVTGSYTDTAAGNRVSFGGVLLQSQRLVTGHWSSATSLGRFWMEPR